MQGGSIRAPNLYTVEPKLMLGFYRLTVANCRIFCRGVLLNGELGTPDTRIGGSPIDSKFGLERK